MYCAHQSPKAQGFFARVVPRLHWFALSGECPQLRELLFVACAALLVPVFARPLAHWVRAGWGKQGCLPHDHDGPCRCLRKREGNLAKQNRVTPLGELIATECRGTLMGNRG